MKLVLDSTSNLDQMASHGGGKALGLARLTHHGFPVPSWFALAREALDLFVTRNQLGPLLARAEASQSYENEVLTRFLAGVMPDEVARSIREALEQRGLSNIEIAVRSSGLDEDSADASFAGQFTSLLFQKGEEQIFSAIKRCWASGYSERALAYRLNRALPLCDIAIGVVLQRMVDATIAGVIFTRHPLKVLSRDLVLVSAVYGAGEGLVSGLLAADTYEISREERKVITRDVAAKSVALRRNSTSGLREEPLLEELKNAACLDDAKLLKLLELALRLELCCGAPQDAEWVIDSKDEMFLVQTRPITTLPPAGYYDKTVNGSHTILWDNSNIIESYSGVTSPLTFSFASRAYNHVYIQFLDIMGVPSTFIKSRAATFRNLLGLIRGRIYYNLAGWYELVLALPGTNSNKDFMETMMGVKQSIAGMDSNDAFAHIKEPPHYSLWAKLILLIKTLYRFVTIGRIIGQFFRHFNAIYDDARRRPLHQMPLPDLLEFYFHLEENFLGRWQAPIINDYLCMIFFGLLKKLTGSWLKEAGGESLQNDLLCGEGGLESTEPTKFLMRLARKIDLSDPDMRLYLLNHDAATIIASLSTTHRETELAAQLRLFLDRWGFRCVNELKLEEPDLHEDPSFIIHSLVGYIRTQSYHVEKMQQRELLIRHKAEQVVNAQLSGIRLFVFRFILKHARHAVKNRENLRFARTKSFGVARHLFRAMGAQLVKCDVLRDERDIFYLTVDEIIAFCEGRVTSGRPAHLVALRKSEFDEYRATSAPPDRFLSRGAVGVSLAYPSVLWEADLLRNEAQQGDDPNKLYGTPCSPGIIEGVVKVVLDLKDAAGICGEILVTARTDPGWVPLFPSCKGLLIERGSLLSHSAVVARELGLPTIVGISGGLLQRLKSGDFVRVDAGKGEITLLKPQDASPGETEAKETLKEEN